MSKLGMLDQETGSDEDIAKALGMVRWIAQQRNANGGFVSTQDTVVALEALSEYAAAIGSKKVALDILISGKTASSNGTTSATFEKQGYFSISEENKLVLQQMKMNKTPSQLSFEGFGEGCAIVQAILRYSVKDAPADAAFILEVNPVPFYWGTSRRVNICARYDGAGESNMVVLEVAMLSGHAPDKAQITKNLDDLRNAGT
jgi:hypothetical protein